MFLSLALCTIIICVLCYYFTRTFNCWQSKNVKGPTPVPFFGNFKEVALRRKHVGMFYYDMYNKYPEEKVVGLYRMTSPTLLIRDLDLVKQILIKEFEVFPDRATYFSKEGLGENIFHADFETWKFLRHKFSSLFTSTKMKGVFNNLVDCSEKFVDCFETASKKNSEQNIYKWVLKYTVGTTMSAIFGLNIDTFSGDNRLFEIIDEKLSNSYVNEMDLIFPGFIRKCNLSVLSDETIKFSHQIVETGKRQQSTIKNGIKNLMTVISKLNIDSNIYDANQNIISDKEVLTNTSDDLQAAQAWMFYTAGYANNTLLLTYVMYHLARNPNVQEKLREEITTTMEKYNGVLSYEALKAMKYLDMVFKETLRMHPLTNGLIRSVSRDVVIEGTNFTLNKGMVIAVSPYAIHHDEKYYPEPERFNPERFLPENMMGRHSCAYLSFGIGPRSCLGTRFARIQFGICVAKMLSKFRVEPSKNTVTSIKFDPRRLLLSPAEEIWLNFLPA